MDTLLIFTLSELRCALSLSSVERILRAVEITPLPKEHDIVLGLVNVQGRIIPVLNIRKIFLLPEVEMTSSDQIIIAHTAKQPVALLVDHVTGVSECSRQELVTPENLFPGIDYLESVTKSKEGIIYIYNLDRFFSAEVASGLQLLRSTPESLSDTGVK